MNFQPVDRAVMFVVLGQAFETRLIQILLVLEMAECITLMRILGFSRCKGMEEEQNSEKTQLHQKQQYQGQIYQILNNPKH